MSHYTPMKVVIKHADAAYDAMLALGFRADQIERHATEQVLYDYCGRDSGLKAHLIVRRSHLGRLQNDLGVKVGKDGALYVCDYAKKNIGANCESRFKQEYGVAVVKRDVKRQGKTCTVERQGGKVKIFVNA